MPTVYIPKTGVEWLTVGQMFLDKGWAVDYGERLYQITPDLICFTGGEDVSPKLYDQDPHPSTFCDSERDQIEIELFKAFLNTPKVGICRGGQFLNVMSGGSMDQDIPNHRNTQHLLTAMFSSAPTVTSNSDHHQGMRPSADAEYVAWSNDDEVIEVCYYPTTKCLCFQPHPEWGHQPTERYFFELIDRFFNLSSY